MSKVEASYECNRIALNVGRLLIDLDPAGQPRITIDGQQQPTPEAFSLHWSRESGKYVLDTITDIKPKKQP